jgi:hypothetical protein
MKKYKMVIITNVILVLGVITFSSVLLLIVKGDYTLHMEGITSGIIMKNIGKGIAGEKAKNIQTILTIVMQAWIIYYILIRYSYVKKKYQQNVEKY